MKENDPSWADENYGPFLRSIWTLNPITMEWLFINESMSFPAQEKAPVMSPIHLRPTRTLCATASSGTAQRSQVTEKQCFHTK